MTCPAFGTNWKAVGVPSFARSFTFTCDPSTFIIIIIVTIIVTITITITITVVVVAVVVVVRMIDDR